MSSTVGRGACSECWQPKIEGGEPVLKTPRPRAQPLFDFDFGWLGVLPGWWWAALVIGCGIAGLLALLVALL
jgi:hypothetical protein